MRLWRSILCAALAAFIISVPTWGAVTNTGVFPQAPTLDLVQILPADTTTQKTLVTCTTNGTKIVGVIVSSTDTATRDVTLALVRSATSYTINTVTIAINAGSVAGTPPVNMMSATNAPGLPLDSDGNPFFYCNTGDTVKVNVGTTVTAAKAVNAIAIGASC